MKKILVGLLVVVACTAVVGWLFRTELFIWLMASRIAPQQPFNAQATPAAPDYKQAAAWAALPESTDPADQLPANVRLEPSGVAVFFVHPTSYFGRTWNQPLDDAAANWLVDERILRHQASVFNSCCEVYAPRYRQATFFSFMDTSGDGERALQLAYEDVRTAFDAFLERLEPRQPFIIAGHSQGTRHASQLVAEAITGTPLQQRLVAAYLVGFSIGMAQLGTLPACAEPTAFGCALGWNAMEGERGGAFGNTEDLLCVNPLNWQLNGPYAAHTLNEGAIGFANYGPGEADEDITRMRVEPGVADAVCTEDGQLGIPELRSDNFPARMFGNSMHVYDYSLFHMNVRRNVAARINAYQRHHAARVTPPQPPMDDRATPDPGTVPSDR